MDGRTDLDGVGEPDYAGALLTPAERRELVRNRCLLRTPVNAGALAALPGWEVELDPLDWRVPDSAVRPVP
ncbi:hypothetical protein ACFVVX_33965 [Kitasatospora sp. NPDC058170]|uniref:hypothetical protein n=1 Tax=Kitasatospora sp. NPDC058170 TaxID=3346364 RepID=UPI0036DF4334